MDRMRILESCRALGTAVLTVALASSAVAQSTRISRTESDFNELNRRLKDNEIGNLNDLRTRSSFDQTPDVDLSNVDRRALANLMKEALNESDRLYASLDADYRNNPQLRSLLADLNLLRNRTRMVNQDLAAGVSLERIVVSFREIDTDWRLFSHRMSQARGLSNTTRQSVERIDGIDQQIGKLFQVAPSIDRQALIQQLGRLDNALLNLSDEIRRDAAASRSGLLAMDVRKLQQQVARIEQIVYNQYPYDRIVTEYNLFERSWNVILDQVRPLSNTYIERAVRQAIEADNMVHELLWMETSTSRAQLKQVADALIKDVDEFYNRTPLKLLLPFKDATSTLQVANDFYGMVQQFQSNLATDESDERLIESYRDIESQGMLFIRTFRPMKSQAALVVLREIEDGITGLRTELKLGGTVNQIDSRKLIPMAAQLENLADQMDYYVRLWMNTERPTYSRDVTAASAAFVKRARSLHRMLDLEPTLQEVQRDADALYAEYSRLNDFLGRCNTAHRQSLSQIAAEIRFEMTELNSSLRL
jgi:HPt (histidine-containing phosphotransfer) domain-containing protein